MEHETERMLAQSRLSLQQYLSIMQKSHEEYHKELEPDALLRVKRDLVLNAVADAEELSANQDEVAQWLDNLNSISNDRPVRMNQLTANQRANIEGRIRRDKALDRLVNIATEGRGDIILPDLAELTGESDTDGADDAVERGAEAAAAAAEDVTAETVDTDDAASAAASAPEGTDDTEVPETGA
jgi:trigger factor